MQSRVQALLPLMSLSVFWQPACCPGESRSYLHLGAASSSQGTRPGVRYPETVYSQHVKMSLIVWQWSTHQHIQLQRLGWREVTDVYVEERRRKYGSLGKTVLQDTLSAELVAEEYPAVSLANKAGDESDCCSVLFGFC